VGLKCSVEIMCQLFYEPIVNENFNRVGIADLDHLEVLIVFLKSAISDVHKCFNATTKSECEAEGE
jgi:hypothetical protein